MPSFDPAVIYTLAGAYVVGATPFGYMAGKMKGIDIRKFGSGNIGATNVIRVLGKGIGIPVFILDMLKGLLPVLFVRFTTGDLIQEIAAAMGAVLGHNFTFWLGYKGGKGVATSAGSLLGLMWLPALFAVGAWMIAFFTLRYVGLASIVAAIVLPIATGVKEGIGPLFYFSVALGALAIWRHRSNIQRMIAGTESKFQRKAKRNLPTPDGPESIEATGAENKE